MSKLKFLILGLVIIIILLILLQVIFSGSKLTQIGTQEDILRKITQSPKPSFYITDPSLDNKEINVIDGFSIIFSKPISYQNLEYEVSPQISIDFILDKSDSILTIKPIGTWDFDTTYTLIIKSETKAKAGESLDKDYEFSFKTVPYSGI